MQYITATLKSVNFDKRGIVHDVLAAQDAVPEIIAYSQDPTGGASDVVVALMFITYEARRKAVEVLRRRFKCAKVESGFIVFGGRELASPGRIGN